MVEVISEELAGKMKEFLTPKFMATGDSEGEPNVVPVMSWTVYSGDTLVYGDFMTYKSRKNLEAGNRRMGILVMTTNLDSWSIKADFESYHRNDEIFEFIAMTPLFRYNQYTNARGAGVATAVWTDRKYKLSKLAVLTSFIRARLAKRKARVASGREGNMPRNVKAKFSQLSALKVICYVGDDGYPVAFPALGMVPVSDNALVVDRNEEQRRGLQIKDGQRVAVSLVTLEPAAFQVKGTFQEVDKNTGVIVLDRVYACSLPRPGVRVDLPMLERQSEPL